MDIFCGVDGDMMVGVWDISVGFCIVDFWKIVVSFGSVYEFEWGGIGYFLFCYGFVVW